MKTQQKKHISASILSANFAALGQDVKTALTAGADSIHFDVMDNHYVPNLTIGPVVCRALRAYGITAPIDVHLMITPVNERIIGDFAKAGATSITFHPDASDDVNKHLMCIREHGCKAGLALNPDTSPDCLAQVNIALDSVLIMSVHPGFGGQAFIEGSLDKIHSIKHTLEKLGQTRCLLAVDGGVKVENSGAIAAAGADVLVAGSAIFHSKDYKKTIAAMRNAV